MAVKYIILECFDYEGWNEAFEGTKKECEKYIENRCGGHKVRKPRELDDLWMFKLPERDMVDEIWEKIKEKRSRSVLKQ